MHVLTTPSLAIFRCFRRWSTHRRRRRIGANDPSSGQPGWRWVSDAQVHPASSSARLTLIFHDYHLSPYTCECSADGTGADFVQMDVTTNVPGVAGLSLAAAKDFDLVAQMPAYVVALTSCPRRFCAWSNARGILLCLAASTALAVPTATHVSSAAATQLSQVLSAHASPSPTLAQAQALPLPEQPPAPTLLPPLLRRGSLLSASFTLAWLGSVRVTGSTSEVW